jgi:hypothetical protein
VQSLGISIAICSATAFGLMIITLLLLPETHGRSLATLETAAAGDRSLSHAYSQNCRFPRRPLLIPEIRSAAFAADKTLLSTFSANLETMSDAITDPSTMAWWRTQPEAWAACRQNLQSPSKVLPEYVQWLKRLPGEPVFVAYPAGVANGRTAAAPATAMNSRRLTVIRSPRRRGRATMAGW